MSHHRFARLALMLAAIGLNAAPALTHSAFAQNKDAPAAAAPAKADTIRPELFKLLDPAQVKPLMAAKNFTEVQNRITQADALPNKTPYESYVIDQQRAQLAFATQDGKALITALEAVLASGRVAPADQPRIMSALAETYTNQKNYPKAIEIYKDLLARGYDKDNISSELVRLYYVNNDFDAVIKTLGPQLDAQVKAGKVPAKKDLQIYWSAAVKQKDNATRLAAVEKLAQYYPSDDYWSDVVNLGIQRKPGFSETNAVSLLRLEMAAIKQLPAGMYTGMAEELLHDGFPTEAKKVMDAGFAAGVLGTGASAAQERQLRERANKQAADDAKTIASGEAAAASSKNGAGLVNTGWAYVTMEQYDKGIGFIERGIAKGGLKSPDEAKLRLGVAYARAGQKDKAIQTFETVKAGGGLSDIAKYWILFLNRRTDAEAAAAAPAAAPAAK